MVINGDSVTYKSFYTQKIRQSGWYLWSKWTVYGTDQTTKSGRPWIKLDGVNGLKWMVYENGRYLNQLGGSNFE